MECVTCGGTAKKVTASRKGRYRSDVVDVQSECYRCESCGGMFFTPDQAEAHTRAVREAIQKNSSH